MRNSTSTGIRAREAVSACHFLPLEGCSNQCGFHGFDGACILLPDVPEGADPREWYVAQLAEARAALEGGAA